MVSCRNWAPDLGEAGVAGALRVVELSNQLHQAFPESPKVWWRSWMPLVLSLGPEQPASASDASTGAGTGSDGKDRRDGDFSPSPRHKQRSRTHEPF